ncbi:extracellular solute-binding protein, partial [Pseudactinotalea sp.]|uniref:extracellular solute-binding protein n=1 Tax=Pseudactinotalea sp. TaxID=1926260 RepID=UPI003B3A70C5
MKKRILPIVALGVTASLGLAGCAGGGNDNGGGTDGEGQTLSVWIMKGTNPDATAFYDEVSAAFEEETGATVEIEEVQWADAHDRFVTAIAGGTTPDIAETGTTWTAEFADAGALLPIDEYVDAEDGLRDDLVEGLEVAGTYDEELYGMPWYAGVRSLVYRTDIFEELGLEAPKTWDDIITAGEAIKAAHPEMMAFPVPGDAEFQVYPWVWGAGGEVATLDGDTWTS